MAVITYKKQHALETDGEYGSLNPASLTADLERQENPAQQNCVRTVGSNCYVRIEPNTGAEKLGVASILDVHVIGTGSVLRGAMVSFYLANEGPSLLENATHIGLPVTEKLRDVLAQLHNREVRTIRPVRVVAHDHRS